jgi:H+/Cl- antiporter ClcA
MLMLETTNSFNLAAPMVVAVWTSRAVSNLISTSIYERELRGKQMPFLRGVCPAETSHILAS